MLTVTNFTYILLLSAVDFIWLVTWEVSAMTVKKTFRVSAQKS